MWSNNENSKTFKGESSVLTFRNTVLLWNDENIFINTNVLILSVVQKIVLTSKLYRFHPRENKRISAN